MKTRRLKGNVRSGRYVPSFTEDACRFGAASVFLARFTAVVRAFVPLLAGILRMSSRQFYVAKYPVGTGVGVLILVWIAWRMIRYKTAAVLECAASQQAPGSDARKSSPRPTFRADRTGQPDR